MIPPKLFSRLCTSLVEQRTHPGHHNDRVLLADECAVGWPQNANAEQLQEWQAIHDRTRADFERAVDSLQAA